MVLEQCENHSRNQSADVLVFILGALYIGLILKWPKIRPHTEVAQKKSMNQSADVLVFILPSKKIRPHSEVAQNWRPESGQEITTSNAWTQYWVHALLVVVWRPECGHHFVCPQNVVVVWRPECGHHFVCAQKLCHRQWLRWRVCVCVCVQCVCVLIVHSVAIDTVGSRPFSDDWHAQCVWQSPVWQSGCMQ